MQVSKGSQEIQAPLLQMTKDLKCHKKNYISFLNTIRK